MKTGELPKRFFARYVALKNMMADIFRPGSGRRSGLIRQIVDPGFAFYTDRTMPRDIHRK